MPLPQENAPWNFYRLGPAKEKELFKRHRETYSGVVIPAHLASYYQKFCLEFVGSLQKPYFIDPVTHIFAADPLSLRRFVKDKETKRTKRDNYGQKVKGDIKRSYQKVISAYGAMIQRVVSESRCIEIGDFKDVAEVNEFVKCVCSFQTETLCELPQKYKKYEKYAAQAGQMQAGQKNHPAFVIPPYFPIENEKWLAVNLDLAKKSRQYIGKLPMFPVIAGRLETLTKNVNKIVDGLASLNAEGVIIWGDGFSGYQSATEIRLFADFVQALAKAGIPVLNLYGDAASLALHYRGLTGFSCGICYGEKRKCDQDMDVEGMIPPFYYVSRLKKKYQLETDLRRVDLNDWDDLLCKCPVCAATDELWSLDDTQVREHFMLARAAELTALRGGQAKKAFQKDMETAYERYRNVAPFSPITHLMSWARLLD